jgi:hypothetical protein
LRLEGIKNATTNAVGSVVAENSKKASESRRAEILQRIKIGESGSVSAPLIAGTVIASSLLGYWYWKRSKR